MDFDFVEAFGEALPPPLEPSFPEELPPRRDHRFAMPTQPPAPAAPAVPERAPPITQIMPEVTEKAPSETALPSEEAETESKRSQYSKSIDDILLSWKKPRRTGVIKGGMVSTLRSAAEGAENPQPGGTQDAMSFEEALGTNSLPHTISESEMRKFTDGTDTFRWDAMIQTMRRPRKQRSEAWSIPEKKMLVKCLQQFGLDFASIAKAFPKRTRGEIRKAFKVMHRANPHYVNALLRQNTGGLSYAEMKFLLEGTKQESA